MYRIIQARAGSDSTLETSGRAVKLAEELYLKPAFACLDNIGRKLFAD
jgi:hypothetical protein